MINQLHVQTSGPGLYEFTGQVASIVNDAGIEEGLCNLLVQHTSASLVIQENADPSARRDLEQWLSRLVPEHDPLYTHIQEGADDMPAHIKSALTATTLSIPVSEGRLALGVWQGLYLWEHRLRGARRHIVMHLGT
ncbi:MAG: secondary thiamine-phosphate synthase enzyme YjbQ [Gammaproteobacteria bacterium]|nr:MAG: secondary thiamine-phosphate synthase enzyme YjbQ [Gammaproteobacteria bacterium]